MTAVCVSGGTSSRQASAPAALYIDSATFYSLLSPGLQWLSRFLPYVPPIQVVDVDAFCAVDPPDPPALVEATLSAVLAGGELGAAIVAAGLIQQVVRNQLWYHLCKCDSGAQPTAPSQAEPSGAVQVNPPAVVTPNPVGSCGGISSAAIVPTITQGARLLGLRLTAGGGPPVTLPAGATMVRVTSHNNSVGATHKNMLFNYWPYPTATQESPATQWVDASGTSSIHDIAIVPGAFGFAMDAQTQDGTATTNSAQVEVVYYCGGQPGQTVMPCCPPDPQATGLLTRILDYVTLIQRQVAPFAYVPGAVHTGLSGNGTIDIQGLIGVAVDITTLPDSYGRADSTPTEYFGLGFISFGTGDGYRSSFRIEHDGQVYLPTAAAAYTTLGYTIAPGIVLTLKELVREP